MSRPSDLVGRSASATRQDGEQKEPADFEELLSASEKHIEYDNEKTKGRNMSSVTRKSVSGPTQIKLYSHRRLLEA